MNGHHSTVRIGLVGGGGHALVVAEAAHSSGQSVIGFFDDHPTSSAMRAHSSWLGTFAEIRQYASRTPLLLAIGALQLRRRLIENHTGGFATVVHPAAVITPRSSLESGSFVAAGAVIGVNADIGQHAIINTRAVVEHDCQVATNVHIGPGAVLGGGVRIGCHTLIGLNASIKSNVTIGSHCIVGAGAVVVKDVVDGEVVVGVPARPIRNVCYERRVA